MTSEDGILQFSIGAHPNPSSGYTLDDNARALLLTIFLDDSAYPYARSYTNYMYKAQKANGHWYNFCLKGNFASQFDSEDSIGRAILACSFGTACRWKDIQNDCYVMLIRSLPRALHFSSPRAIAYVLLGLCKAQLTFCPEKLQFELIKDMSYKLLLSYQRMHSTNWRWFETYLTYCNGIIPHALFAAFNINGDKKILHTAYESLNFLNDQLFAQGYLNIIGNNGWYHKDCKRAYFDQQPVDAASMVFACSEAYQTLAKNEYRELAEIAHCWYRGKNAHKLSLYDENSRGCYDALTKEGINLNQGAESLLSLLLSDMLIEKIAHEEKDIYLSI